MRRVLVSRVVGIVGCSPNVCTCVRICGCIFSRKSKKLDGFGQTARKCRRHLRLQPQVRGGPRRPLQQRVSLGLSLLGGLPLLPAVCDLGHRPWPPPVLPLFSKAHRHLPPSLFPIPCLSTLATPCQPCEPSRATCEPPRDPPAAAKKRTKV